MTWFKVDDGFANSRPVLEIPRRYRAQAVGLWTLAGTWSAKELTDGHVPMYVVREVGASTPAIAALLVKVGLWESCSCCDGFLFVGWIKYQPTKDQVLQRRSEEQERKARARAKARQAADQREYENVPVGHRTDNDGCPQVVQARSEHPDPTRPDPTRPLSLVTSSRGVALVEAHVEPPRQCQSHINDPNPPRCPRCADARKANEAWVSARKAEQERVKSEYRRAVDACCLCDDQGMRDVGDGATRCDHAPAVSNA